MGIFNLIHRNLFEEALKFGKDVTPPQLIAKNLKFILEKVTISNLNLAQYLILFGHYAETLPEKNHRIYVDNYFSFVQLAKFLYSKFNNTKPRRCVHHSKFQPNKKKRYDSLYGCFQCNSHMCCDCFRISHTTGT